MIKSVIKLSLLFLLFSSPLYAGSIPPEPSNFINIKSNYSVSQTLDRLESILKEKGIKVFARINHSKGAESIGDNLRNTELLIFGSPKIGTPLMKSNQLIGIDLPLKVLAWQDEKGNVWLSYNSPDYLSKKYNINDKDEVFNKIKDALNNFVNYSTK